MPPGSLTRRRKARTRPRRAGQSPPFLQETSVPSSREAKISGQGERSDRKRRTAHARREPTWWLHMGWRWSSSADSWLHQRSLSRQELTHYESPSASVLQQRLQPWIDSQWSCCWWWELVRRSVPPTTFSVSLCMGCGKPFLVAVGDDSPFAPDGFGVWQQRHRPCLRTFPLRHVSCCLVQFGLLPQRLTLTGPALSQHHALMYRGQTVFTIFACKILYFRKSFTGHPMNTLLARRRLVGQTWRSRTAWPQSLFTFRLAEAVDCLADLAVFGPVCQAQIKFLPSKRELAVCDLNFQLKR